MLKKRWFGCEQNNCTLRVGKKQGVAEPFFFKCHLAISWSLSGHHTSNERGISRLSADEKFLSFVKQIAIFKHIFELGWPQQRDLYILVCHSVTSWSRASYHTSFERGYSGLSYDPKY